MLATVPATWDGSVSLSSLPATSDICKVIVQRADAGAIRNLAVRQGMRLLRDDGWDKVRQGVTTLAELLRVTREEEA